MAETGQARTAREPLLEARGVTKQFGTVIANDAVDLLVREGEIHALLGENGAGKSTLVKIVYGILAPNGGELIWRGQSVALRAPANAQALGIGMVFQHFSLFEALTVAENIALALPKGTSSRQVAEKVRGISEEYGLPLDPHRRVYSLSVGERQRIEIVRCLMQNPRLIIMDEPTAVLTPQEADKLFETLVRLAAEGCAILYISHRLEEVKRICSTATVLRRGRVVATCDPRKETAATLARMMVGADVKEVKPPGAHEFGPVRLKIESLSSVPEDPLGTALREVTFEVRGGEILGIAGVAGNGQEELFQALAGIVSADRPEQIRIDDQPVGRSGINARRRKGAAFAPEERIGEAAVARFKLSDNVLLSGHETERLVNGGIIDSNAARQRSAQVIERFDVRVGSPDPEAGSLSGGNLQKFVVGREMMRSPGVFVLNQPTWGVDAGAAAIIRQAMIDLAAKGSALVVISQDLDEIFQIADSIAAISHGRLSPTYPAAEMNMEKVGLLMGGVHASDSVEASDAA